MLVEGDPGLGDEGWISRRRLVRALLDAVERGEAHPRPGLARAGDEGGAQAGHRSPFERPDFLCVLCLPAARVHYGGSETSEDDTSALAGPTPALAAVLRIFADW